MSIGESREQKTAVISHLWLLTNQKPQAARLRQDDLGSKNHLHHGTGGALKTSISATCFSAIFANLLSCENLLSIEEFITGAGNRQVLLNLSRGLSKENDGKNAAWLVETGENSFYTEGQPNCGFWHPNRDEDFMLFVLKGFCNSLNREPGGTQT